MVSDRVGDFIIRLQNASMIGQKSVRLPYSAHLDAIARKLKSLGFVAEVSKEAVGESTTKKVLIVTLAYDTHGTSKIRGVKRLSKPGRRMYIPHTAAHSVAAGEGARVISTPSGILSDREARKNRVGGETLFEIW